MKMENVEAAAVILEQAAKYVRVNAIRAVPASQHTQYGHEGASTVDGPATQKQLDWLNDLGVHTRSVAMSL